MAYIFIRHFFVKYETKHENSHSEYENDYYAKFYQDIEKKNNKMKVRFGVIVLGMIVLSQIFVGCKKDDENKMPICSISLSDQTGKIEKGLSITIELRANDSDGKIVMQQLFIDGVKKEIPDNGNYVCNTDNYQIGNHNIEFVVFDNDGATSSSNINFEIIKATTIPVVSTKDVTEIKKTSVKCGGIVKSDGGKEISERGICWGLNSNPTVADNKLIDNGGEDDFETVISGLAENTKYYVRSFAKNEKGVAYGNEISFTTLSGENMVTDYEGNVYRTVKIGNQTWMAENLRSKKYSDGTAISEVYAYGGNEDIVVTYGRHYTWKAAMRNSVTEKTQGACPTGWHVPSADEWDEMITLLGGNDVAGGKLKETGTDYWNAPNVGADNSSGFSAVGAGLVKSGSEGNLKTWAYFYSSTRLEDYNNGYNYLISAERTIIDKSNRFATWDAMSIRCVKD